ncbi:MAG: hypothetical protein WBA93_15295 [Microcoleaceae cyanobacterium]
MGKKLQNTPHVPISPPPHLFLNRYQKISNEFFEEGSRSCLRSMTNGKAEGMMLKIAWG